MISKNAINNKQVKKAYSANMLKSETKDLNKLGDLSFDFS